MLRRRGQDRGDDPETGGDGRAARLEEDAQNPQQRVLRISFVCWSTERKRFGGNCKWFADFWATGGSIDLRKRPNTSSLMYWGGNGGDLSSLWARSAVFSKSTG